MTEGVAKVETLFSRRTSIGVTVSVYAHQPERIRIKLPPTHDNLSLTIEQLDEHMDTLKGARRAARHAAWKAGNTGAMNGPAQPVSDEERRRAAQTDPEWARRMLADPPRPVNETIREDIERELGQMPTYPPEGEPVAQRHPLDGRSFERAEPAQPPHEAPWNASGTEGTEKI